MKTAVIYARYSSERQTEQSIEGQLRKINEYVVANNIMVVNTYIDRAMTGTNDNRKAFQQMMKDSSKKAWDYVLVYKLDRFSRDKYETAIHRHTLKTNGVKLISVMENIPDTPEGIILESLLEGMNQYYSAELSQKVKRGLNESRLKGNFTGGYLMFGYNVVGDKVSGRKLVINEDEAEIVKQVFTDFSNGRIVVDILKELVNSGITNKGKPFSRTYLYNMLNNEKYSGNYHYNGQLYTNIYPQIVPTDIYLKVQAKLNANRYGKHIPDVVYLLKNKIRCGYCGKPIASDTGTSHTGIVKRYYKCSGRKHENSCKKTAVQKDILEDLVLSSVMNALSSPSVIANIAEKIVNAHKLMLEDKSILNLLLSEKAEIDASLDNLVKAIENGLLTETTKNRLKTLELKKKEIDEKILLEQSRESLLIKKEDIIRYLKTAVKKEPIVLIDLLIKEIVLYDDKIEITLNYTERTDGNEHRPFNFYSNTKTYKIFANKYRNRPILLTFEVNIYI